MWYIIAGLVTLLIIGLAILVFLLPGFDLIPNSGIFPIRNLNDSELDREFYYTVYGKLTDIQNFEKIEGVSTPNKYYSTLNQEATKWLDTYFTETGKTTGNLKIYKTTPRKLLEWRSNIPLRVINENYLGTLNFYVKFPGDIVLDHFNFVNCSQNNKTVSQWVEERKWSNASQQFPDPIPADYKDLKLEPTTNQRRLFIICDGAPNTNTIYDTALLLGYNYDTFMSGIQTMYVSLSGEVFVVDTVGGSSPTGITIQNSIYTTDALLAVMPLTGNSRPDIVLVIGEVIDQDLNSFFWKPEFQNGVFVTAVQTVTPKINPRDYSRIAMETRFLSAEGRIFVTPSGQSGPYQRTGDLLDIDKPDVPIFSIQGDGVITVGSLNYIRDVGFGSYSSIGQLTSSGGGFRRGYSRPGYKRNIRYENITWNTFDTSNVFKPYYPPADFEGDTVPDISMNALYAADGTEVTSELHGAVLAAGYMYKYVPVTAKAVYKRIYEKPPQRDGAGSNALGPLPGYNLDRYWDPVQGLGVASAFYFKNLY